MGRVESGCYYSYGGDGGVYGFWECDWNVFCEQEFFEASGQKEGGKKLNRGLRYSFF